MNNSPENQNHEANKNLSFSGTVIMGLAVLNIVVFGGSMGVSPEVSQQAIWENARSITLLIDLVAIGLGSYMNDIGQD